MPIIINEILVHTKKLLQAGRYRDKLQEKTNDHVVFSTNSGLPIFQNSDIYVYKFLHWVGEVQKKQSLPIFFLNCKKNY